MRGIRGYQQRAFQSGWLPAPPPTRVWFPTPPFPPKNECAYSARKIVQGRMLHTHPPMPGVEPSVWINFQKIDRGGIRQANGFHKAEQKEQMLSSSCWPGFSRSRRERGRTNSAMPSANDSFHRRIIVG